MAYYRKYRKLNAELAAYVVSSSESSVSDGEQFALNHSVSNDVADDTIKCSSIDSESDYGYVENVLSSDPEEEVLVDTDLEPNITGDTDVELPNITEEVAAWATKHCCTRSCVNDILDILRRNGHDLPKDMRSLLETPRQNTMQGKMWWAICIFWK